jgi:PBP1b-binding outer membrane lipoprotein LpoB
MKKIYYLSAVFLAAMFFVSCSDSDNNGSQEGNGDKARTDEPYL